DGDGFRVKGNSPIDVDARPAQLGAGQSCWQGRLAGQPRMRQVEPTADRQFGWQGGQIWAVAHIQRRKLLDVVGQGTHCGATAELEPSAPNRGPLWPLLECPAAG